mmetsp:Transcript_36862/g.117388  ORF Transcript_36862/g.117388 Transcript_36862/m.117388 type:complete len:221 (+) Transcript_36862:143-805(+)
MGESRSRHSQSWDSQREARQRGARRKVVRLGWPPPMAARTPRLIARQAPVRRWKARQARFQRPTVAAVRKAWRGAVPRRRVTRDQRVQTPSSPSAERRWARPLWRGSVAQPSGWRQSTWRFASRRFGRQAAAETTAYRSRHCWPRRAPTSALRRSFPAWRLCCCLSAPYPPRPARTRPRYAATCQRCGGRSTAPCGRCCWRARAGSRLPARGLRPSSGWH